MSTGVKHAADLSSEEKRALLARLLQEQARKPKVLPASFAQEQLWFLDQLEPGLSAYNIHMAVRLVGRLNQAAIEQSLDEIVRRHETLRTAFGVSEGKPVQIISVAGGGKSGLPLQMHDLQKMTLADRAAKVQQLATQEAQQPFDLARGPLMRAALLRLEENEHVLLLTTHHSISDGWSMGILYRELGQLYRAFANGQPPPLPPLPIQYADYAVWQRERLQGETLEALLSYWKETLGGNLPTLELPGDHVRPAVQSFRGASHIAQFPAALHQRVQNLSRQAGVTTFMTLLAAFKTLLYRYTGQQDVIVGTPIANRNRAEVEGIIGFFMNMLVLRTELSSNFTFRELLSRVQKVASGAYAHSDLPFEILVKELQPQRDLSRSPLFQMMFVLQNTVEQVTELPELKLSVLPVKRGSTHYDLSVHLFETLEGMEGVFEYNTDLFEKETIKRLAGHYQTLLEGGIANPEQRLADLPLLTDAERQQILVEWNATRTEYAPDRCIHQLFEARAGQTPDAVAVIFQDQHLTYCQLDRRANQLAHYLQARDVQPDCLVGIYMPRSLETMVGILGVLKAGGAYVPLDPAYPEERQAFMVADTQTPLLLTQARWANRLAGHETRVICLDADWKNIAQESDEEPVSDVAPNNLAYVIYTSGSTGQPKGVLVPHRGLPNVVQTMIQTFALTPQDRVLQFSSLSFDASVYDILLALGSGATLCLAHENLLPDLGLSRWLQDVGATIIPLTASTLAALPSDGLATLRIVISGAEACPAELVARWSQDRRFFNVYGPTEATIWTSVTECSNNNQKPAIGRPISNVQVYILDAHLQPAPAGVVGEICIGGIGVTRGYLNSPALTAAKFIPHPFGLEPGVRLYRTGDLARYLPDGNIDFLGRLDHQVKVRGFRIELGEIEAALKQHPMIQETVVLAREDTPGNKRLVAYIVPQKELGLAPGDLRRFLKDKLPEYMAPSAFVILTALPLTPNGKVDRWALPAPDTAHAEPASDWTAPYTPAEEMLAALWVQVLGIKRMGIHDDFFQLGGHSLLATQLISRIRETFQIELPLRALFEEPTLAKLSERIELALRSEQGLLAPPLAPAAREGKLPLSFAQQRLWFLDRLEPGSAAYNLPTAVRLVGPLDVAALEHSFNETVQRHEALRTTFQTIEGQAVQVIAPALTLLLPIIDLRALAEAEREAESRRLATEEAQRPFDLARGPLVRVTMLRLDSEEHVLLLTMHHIISDGWSMGVFIQETATLYEAFVDKMPASLPDLPIQYTDFAIWQRNWLRDEVLETQLSYWKARLSGTLGVLELPTDRPRPSVQTFHGTIQSLALSKELSEALKALSQREGVTLFMTLLAAFKTLLYRYTGQEDIVIGSPIANRNRTEVEGLIGFFVNTLVLRTNLSGNPSFQKLLSQVREMTLGAYAHQDLPFEMLVEQLGPERNLSRTPLFQVMFILQNAPLGAIESPSLTLSPFEADSRTAKFDLTLSMVETEQGLRGALEYNLALFDAPTITRMAAHFDALLRGITADPAQPIATLPVMTDTELHQLLTSWNDTQTAHPPEKCIPGLFEAQAEQTPDAVAVVFEDKHLTYWELNRRANQLARHLQAQGVGPDRLVGIYMARALEAMVGILGTLKAGGAYVPLDPTYPEARLAFMLADTRPLALLTQAQWTNKIVRYHIPAICLDVDWEDIAQESDENLAGRATVENLAYVIYTSGSTGQPKGVMVPHRALINHVPTLMKVLGLSAGDRLLQFISLSFDASVEEYFPTLLSGATLVLSQPDTAITGDDFTRFCEQHQINFLHLPASFWHQWVDALAASGLSAPLALKALLVGGESPTVERLQAWSRLVARPTQFLNAYGPTEATVTTTLYEIPCDERGILGLHRVPIGRPISNARVYLLDQQQRPAPVGVTGELYIGGDGVARGYLNRPELTMERFVADPFSNKSGARLYRTGDLARYLPDGNIEFLGRADHQVKIRGFRVEPEEIGAVLSQHPAVQEAAVLAWEDESAEKRLVAYVVPQGETPPGVSELRNYLKEKLPIYMSPSAYVMLNVLPRTPTGKIDRRALPAPDGARPALEANYVAPRNEVETILAKIWAKVLGLDRVGVYDNFFELGGDSIISIQVIAKAKQAGLLFTPKQFFEHQTIAELVPVIESTTVIQAEQNPVTGLTSLTPIQHWFFEWKPLEPHHFTQSLLLETKQALDPSLLTKVLQQLILHHDALRLRFVQTASDWQQIQAGQDSIAPLSQIELSALPPTEQRAAIERAAAELQTSLNLPAGPLMRVALFNLGEQKAGRLFIVIHHLAVDGVSWRILLEDLQTAYRQLGQGETIQLPLKTTSFKHWAGRLVEYAQSETVQQEIDDWLARPWNRVSPLPVDYAGGANTVASADTVSVSLSAQETQTLLREVPQTYRTQINDVLLTAVAQTLAQWTGNDVVLLDLEGHGREEIFHDVDVSRTVGWFTAIFPVLLDLKGSQEPGKTLKAVKEQLGHIPNKGINYGVLRYLSRKKEIVERLQSLPQSQISFNYLGQLDHVLPKSSVFAPAVEATGSHRSHKETRRHLLEINGSTNSGRLQLSWTYSNNLYYRSTIENLAQGFVKALRKLIAHCCSPKTQDLTPADFPAARLNQEELDEFIARLGLPV